MPTMETLQDVFVEQLADLYSAERQLVETLPEVARAASTDDLREAVTEHLEETRGHVRRLDEIFEQMSMQVPKNHCEAMEGLIREGDEVVRGAGDPVAKDVALIAAAQRIEHYEIAGYGTARTLARELGLNDAAERLAATLDEESDADKKLTKIATGGMIGSGVNTAAAAS